MSIGDVTIFDRLSGLYDYRPPIDRSKLRAGLALAERDLDRVLDLGGGTGQGVRALDAPDPIVLDAAGGMVRRAADRGLAALQGDAAQLPVAADTVDAVLITDALHHMADQEQVLAEAARVLRPGGVLVVREYDPTTVRGRALAAGEHLFGMESTFLPSGDLAAMVRRVGLSASIPDRGFAYTLAGLQES